MGTPASPEDDGTLPANLNPDLKRYIKSQSNDVRSTNEYVRAIREGDRATLSRAITLVESTRPVHRAEAQRLLDACLPHTGDSVRMAVTGVPGVGKSTFIEALGMQLVDDGHRLAVLAIDPTSERTKGSILGDKTRMEQLARRGGVFIRPSPAGGSTGGVAHKTRETILLCEAAGFDIVFVETVGVGQSEVAVHTMVDFFLLLVLANAGDELQGIKRGIVEMADAIAINKADNANQGVIHRAQADYQRALRLFPPEASGWEPPVLTCSGLTGEGVSSVWQTVQDYIERTKQSGFFEAMRHRQARHWMHQTIEQRLRDDFFDNPDVRAALDAVEAKVEAGTLSPVAAADELLARYRRYLDDQSASGQVTSGIDTDSR